MIVNSEAIVLRSRQQGETSKIVTLYTLAYGKLNVIAKGAREMKSKFGGALEAFSHINAIFYKKENVEPGLYLLSKAETIESNAGILNSLSKIEAATGIVELMRRSMHDEEATPAIFELLRSVFPTVAVTSHSAVATLEFWFAIQFLHAKGFEIEAGTDRNVSPEAESVLCSLIEANLSQAAQLQIPERAESKVRAFLQSYFVEHLPGMTGRSMRSGRVFSSL